MTSPTTTEYAHGTYASYQLGRCRCRACLLAVKRYRVDRERQIAAGTWRVDADLVRARLRALSAAGIGKWQVAKLTGIDPSVIDRILRGRAHAGTPPPKTTRRDIADKIFSVPLEHADGLRTEASGTARRLQALCAIGNSQRQVAKMIGKSPANFGTLMRRIGVPYAATVERKTAKLVADVYDREWQRVPTGPRADAARARAAELGWFGPGAWDDATIDDPDALPCVLPGERRPGVDELALQHAAAGHPGELDSPTRAEWIRRLHAGGAGRTAAEIARIVGVTDTSVAQVLRKEELAAA